MREPILSRPPILSIFIISGLALAYEVLLMRLFSIIQWHHFAYMVISLALLGFGASGAFLATFRRRFMQHFGPAYTANVVSFGFSTLLCFGIAQRLGFNPEEMLWDSGQLIRLMLVYLVLAVPFFFGANVVGLALMVFGRKIPKIYSADLIGAGTGSALVLLLLSVMPPLDALRAIATIGIAVGALGWWEVGLRPRLAGLVWVLVAGLPLLSLGAWGDLRISDYKAISQTLRIPDTRILVERSSPLGLVQVVESSMVPFRHAPGLSLNARMGVPEQLGLFVDGDRMTPVQRFHGNRLELEYLDYLTSALPYHLRAQGQVFVVGAGGGAQVLQALYHQIPRIDAIELDPGVIELVRSDFSAYSGELYRHPSVRVFSGDARGFLESSDEVYDAILLAFTGSFGASAAGLYALSEDYLYTVEAFEQYLDHLAPDGYLAVTGWVRVPPRDALKAFGTAIRALARQGVSEPRRHLALIRGWQTSTLLVKNEVLEDDEIAKLRSFCRERSFDLAYYPGMKQTEANRYNLLEHPWFHEGATALLSEEADRYIDRYKFNIEPATDERPYFSNFFRWKSLPEIAGMRGRGGLALLESGYLVLVATLVQAIAAAFVLILGPVVISSRMRSVARRAGGLRVLVYFGALGFAFLFIEVSFIQKGILFMHHPIYAIALVLTSFLFFAGLGSRYAQARSIDAGATQAMRRAVGLIGILGLVYAVLLGPLFRLLIAAPGFVRAGLLVVIIAPLAFSMGQPFPLGLRRLDSLAPSLTPWAWGINGCTSVISAVVATLLAVHFGFTLVLLAAVILYLIAAVAFPR